jgi:hypothetical protein
MMTPPACSFVIVEKAPVMSLGLRASRTWSCTFKERAATCASLNRNAWVVLMRTGNKRWRPYPRALALDHRVRPAIERGCERPRAAHRYRDPRRDSTRTATVYPAGQIQETNTVEY